VLAEADEGLRRGVLVPVLLDDVTPPLTFRSLASVDLRRDFKGVILSVVVAVSDVVTRPPGTPQPAVRGPEPRSRSRPVWSWLAVAAIFLLASGAGSWFVLSDRRNAIVPVSAELPGSAEVPEFPLAVGITEIRAGGDAPPWMADITQQGLNALLSKFDKLTVFSKEVIDFMRQKTGKSFFEIAKDLRMRRIVNGIVIREGVKVSLQVSVVDADTGQLLASCEAHGTEDKLVDIQNDVGLQILQALKVPVTKVEVDRALAARTNVDLDVTKRFSDAFGGMEEEVPAKNGSRP
jgi:TolB-like protein